jgi:hypothetical protein
MGITIAIFASGFAALLASIGLILDLNPATAGTGTQWIAWAVALWIIGLIADVATSSRRRHHWT